jgi:hypothetical protein
MNRPIQIYITLSLSLLLLLGCEHRDKTITIKAESISATSQKIASGIEVTSKNTQTLKNIVPENKKILTPSNFMTTEWVDLIPKDDLDALLNPPDYIDEIAENSAEDQLDSTFQNSDITDSISDDPYQQALVSTRVISAVHNVAIKIPAFIVPFFGACIHLPPPPPNQTIFVNYPQGFTLESINEPYFISGVLKTSLVKNDKAIAAYSLDMHSFEKYYDEDE